MATPKQERGHGLDIRAMELFLEISPRLEATKHDLFFGIAGHQEELAHLWEEARLTRRENDPPES